MSEYTIYGGELSLFTRKLEAAMIFYGADYELVAKTSDNSELIETRAASHQVPVLQTPENWMLADTTPIMCMLDARFAGREMFPSGPEGLLVHMLEEYFDEWVARTMVHYRWHYPESAEFASLRMANGNSAVAERVRDWGPRACRATGTESQVQRDAAEAEYLRIMEQAEAQLKLTPFLLGGRPTALDCIVLGGLRAHTNMDPDPKRAIAKYPIVVEWSEQRADTWQGDGELVSFTNPTPFAQFILEEMSATYGRYVLANASAQQAGAKACNAEIYGEQVSYLSRPYPEKSRQMVSARAQPLLQNSEVQNCLNSYALAEVFA